MPRDRYDDEYDDDRPRRRSRRDDDEYDDDRPRRRSYRYADSGPPQMKLNVCGVLSLIGGIASVLANFLQIFTCCLAAIGGWLPSAVGIVGGVSSLALGITGLVQANKSGGKMGSGLALTGTILGGVAIIFSVLWLSIFAALFAARPAFPTGGLATTPGGTTGPGVTANDRVEATLTAAELARAYDNEAHANVDYEGEILEVTGALVGGPQYATDGTKVVLAGQTGRSVTCLFDPSRRNSVTGLAGGNTVTVRGRCGGLDGNAVKLTDCLLMPGPTAPDPFAGRLAPAVLTQAFDADPVRAKTKYLDQKLDVAGTIDRIDRSQGAAVIVIYATPTGQLSCWLDKTEGAKLAKAKTGDVVALRGRCTYMGFGPVELVNCTVLK